MCIGYIPIFPSCQFWGYGYIISTGNLSLSLPPPPLPLGHHILSNIFFIVNIHKFFYQRLS